MRQIASATLGPLVKPLDMLRHDPDNVNEHPQAQIDVLAANLAEHGQDEPLVYWADDDGQQYRVLKGNCRLSAMRLLGWTEAVCVPVTGTLTEARRRALADHGSKRHSHIDPSKMLAQMLGSLTDDGRQVPGLDEQYAQQLEDMVARMAEDRAETETGETSARADDDDDGDVMPPYIKTLVLEFSREEIDDVLQWLTQAQEDTETDNHTDALVTLIREAI